MCCSSSQQVLVAVATHVGRSTRHDQSQPVGPGRVVALNMLQGFHDSLDLLLARKPTQGEQDEAPGIDLVAAQGGLTLHASTRAAEVVRIDHAPGRDSKPTLDSTGRIARGECLAKMRAGDNTAVRDAS